MAMNTPKVLVGGLAAGIVLLAIDFVTNMYILGDRMRVEAEAFKPGLADAMQSGKAMVIYIITDLVIGLLLVWTYAAIRPRFGPGMRTASAAAILFWLLGSFFTANYLMMGMMSRSLWWTFGIVWLVNLNLAAWAGAKLYTEDGGSATV